MAKTKQKRMTTHVKIAIAVVAVIGVVAVTAHAFERGGPDRWRGAWAGHGHHGIEGFCRDGAMARLDGMTALVESFAAFDGRQQAAWTRLKAAIGEGEDVLRDACARFRDDGAAIPARLARVEALLGAGARALAVVRPAADAFYGALDADQRAALDAMAGHRRRR